MNDSTERDETMPTPTTLISETGHEIPWLRDAKIMRWEMPGIGTWGAAGIHTLTVERGVEDETSLSVFTGTEEEVEAAFWAVHEWSTCECEDPVLDLRKLKAPTPAPPSIPVERVEALLTVLRSDKDEYMANINGGNNLFATGSANATKLAIFKIEQMLQEARS